MEGRDSQATVHPDAEQFQRFSRGLLPPADAAALEVRRWQGHDNTPVFRIVVAPDGGSAWSVANDFRRWDVATGTTTQRVVTSLRHEELLPSLDGKQFLTMAKGGA
jgi:hypothetical protein